MITDGTTIPSGTQLSTQVCIVGSGQAGITAAWQLQKAGIKVTLIEGSRMYNNVQDSWPDKVLLYNGVSDGLFKTNEPEFLNLPVTCTPFLSTHLISLGSSPFMSLAWSSGR